VIDVELNPETSFAATQPFDKLVARFNRHRSPLSTIVAPPPTYQDMGEAALAITSGLLDFAGLGPIGTLVEKIGFARGFGFSISRSDGSFPIEFVAIMKDEAAAGFLSGTLNLLKGMTTLVPQQNMSQSDREAIQAFQSMTIVRDHEILSVTMVMAEKDLMR
jgi:hypothetical protein